MGNDSNGIGARIKEKRKELGVTQKEIAARAKLSPAFLSQVENGKISLTITSLERIARALDTPIVQLFVPGISPVEPSITRDSRSKQDPVRTPENRPRLVLPASNTEMELLSPTRNQRFVAYIQRFKPQAVYIANRLIEPTEQMIYLLSGKLLVGLESGNYILETGHSIYYNDFDKLHRFEVLSENQDAELLVVMSPPVY